MNSETLIELVREHRELYDPSDLKYMDTRRKTEVWEEIGRQMGTSGSACKSRWTNIRDQFRKLLTKRQAYNGQNGFSDEEKYVRKYKYEDELQFLLPFTNDRKTLNTAAIESDHSVDVPEFDNGESYFELGEIIPEPILTEDVATESKRKRRKHDDNQTSVLMKYILDRTEKPEHHIDAFLTGIAVTLKSLCPYYQHVAKGRIFNIVQELELEQMEEEHAVGELRLSSGESSSKKVSDSSPTETTIK